MRLARKMTIGLILGILAVMAAYTYAQIRQEVRLSDADLARGRRIGLAWLGMLEGVWDREGPARAQELVERANRRTEGLSFELIPGGANNDSLTKYGLSDAQRHALADGAIVQSFTRDEQDTEWHHALAALGGSRPAVVALTESHAPQRAFIRTNHTELGLATLAITGVCGVIATVLLYGMVGKPIAKLRDKTRRAGAGDFSGPLQIRQRDEIGDLAADINSMCDQIGTANQRLAEETDAHIAALEQLRHAERLATVGRLAAGVAHELGTPLNVVSARAELLVARELPHAEVAKNASIIGEQADRISAIIQQLLDFSRRRSGTPGLANLPHLVTRALDLLSSAAKRAHVRMHSDPGREPLMVRVDQNQILQALTNVMMNAIQAMPQGGELRISTGACHATPPADVGGPAGDYLCVRVEDNGVGIPPDRLPHIFEPFFTTKSVGEGTGLGLAVAHGIISEHGGWIAVESELGKGSRFSIYLPVPADAGETAAA
jgi:signal transduction histidine kinase